MSAFEAILQDALPHGVLVGVALPGTKDPVPDEVLERLLPEEQAYARTLAGFRQPEWVGGRLAAREAFRGLGRRVGPLLTDRWGAPALRGGVVVSVSHKRHLAVALAARSEHGALGVDLEEFEPSRMSVAERVLTPPELAEVQALPESRQWTSLLLRFAVKEAIYKALAPRLRRYIGFEEARVFPDTDCTARVELALTDPPALPAVEARYVWLERGVLATVRARWPDARGGGG